MSNVGIAVLVGQVPLPLQVSSVRLPWLVRNNEVGLLARRDGGRAVRAVVRVDGVEPAGAGQPCVGRVERWHSRAGRASALAVAGKQRAAALAGQE
ncbi:hypothetical protein A7R80_14375 [Staphylococcus aureus]|nr:hypothetical protein A7R80_14375 [Staphylococcus aureus]